MTCPKCSGLIVTYHGESRCCNCGFRDGDIGRQVGSHDALNWVDRNPPSDKEFQEVEF